MSIRRITRVSVFSMVLAVFSSVASAGLIYNVNRTIGVGSVTGSIETDGTIGVLGNPNILDWNLTLDDGTGPFTLFGPLSGNNSQLQISGTSFTSTFTDLLFDFTNGNGDYVLFQNPLLGSAINFWCMEGVTALCSGNVSAETVTTFGPYAEVMEAQRGVVSVATGDNTPPPPIPVPATLVLFSLGLACLGWSKRKV